MIFFANERHKSAKDRGKVHILLAAPKDLTKKCQKSPFLDLPKICYLGAFLLLST